MFEFLTYLLRHEIVYFRGFYSIFIMKTSPSKVLIFFLVFVFSEPHILADQDKGTPSSPPPTLISQEQGWRKNSHEANFSSQHLKWSQNNENTQMPIHSSPSFQPAWQTLWTTQKHSRILASAALLEWDLLLQYIILWRVAGRQRERPERHSCEPKQNY